MTHRAKTWPILGVKAIMAEAGIPSGPRKCLENKIIFQIKKLKQKDCLTHKLVSGGAEQELYRGAADRQNDLSLQGGLDMGQNHSCMHKIICRPTFTFLLLGDSLAFPAQPCPFDLCTH